MPSSTLTDIYKAYNPRIYGSSSARKRLGCSGDLNFPLNGARAYRCDLCGKGFTDLLQYIGHSNRDEECRRGDQSCQIRGKEYTKYSGLSNRTYIYHPNRQHRSPIIFDSNTHCLKSPLSVDTLVMGESNPPRVELQCDSHSSPRKLKVSNSVSRLPCLDIISLHHSIKPRPVTLFANTPNSLSMPRAMYHATFENKILATNLDIGNRGVRDALGGIGDVRQENSLPNEITFSSAPQLQGHSKYVSLVKSLYSLSNFSAFRLKNSSSTCANLQCQTLIAHKNSEITRLKASMLQILRDSHYKSQQILANDRRDAFFTREINTRVTNLRKQVTLIGIASQRI